MENHTKSRYTVGKYIRKFNLEQEKHMIIIFEGNDAACFEMEFNYRPFPNIGLNEAAGGRGGYLIPHTLERNEKISRAMRGKPKSKEHKEKLSKIRIETGIAKRENNNNAKKWVLTSPSNVEYYAHGNLAEICREHVLLESALRYKKGSVVPEPNLNGYGGYRAKSKESFNLRVNTTGWSLREASNAMEV